MQLKLKDQQQVCSLNAGTEECSQDSNDSTGLTKAGSDMNNGNCMHVKGKFHFVDSCRRLPQAAKQWTAASHYLLELVFFLSPRGCLRHLAPGSSSRIRSAGSWELPLSQTFQNSNTESNARSSGTGLIGMPFAACMAINNQALSYILNAFHRSDTALCRECSNSMHEAVG